MNPETKINPATTAPEKIAKNELKQENPESSHNCCNQETQVYSRVVGYIRPTDHWNVAKKEEFENRKTYTAPKE